MWYLRVMMSACQNSSAPHGPPEGAFPVPRRADLSELRVLVARLRACYPNPFQIFLSPFETSVIRIRPRLIHSSNQIRPRHPQFQPRNPPSLRPAAHIRPRGAATKSPRRREMGAVGQAFPRGNRLESAPVRVASATARAQFRPGPSQVLGRVPREELVSADAQLFAPSERADAAALGAPCRPR